MKIYSYDAQGNFVEAFEAQLDQLESKKKGVPIYLLPANATFVAPGKPKSATNKMVWNGKSWIETPPPAGVVEVVQESEVTVKEPTKEELDARADWDAKVQAVQAKQAVLREKLMSARKEGITAKNAPAVLSDLIDLVLA